MGMTQLKKPTAGKKPAGKKPGGKKPAGKKGGKKKVTAGTAANNAVAITNVDVGESIPMNFDVTIAYTNNSGGPATVTLSCDGVASVSTAVGTGSGTVTLNLAHGATGTGHTMAARMTDGSSTPVASDQITPVDVVDPTAANPELTIISNTMPASTPPDMPTLDPNQDATGLYDPTMGGDITIEIEDPITQTAARRTTAGGRKGHRKLNFSDPADPNDAILGPHKKRWRHVAIPNPDKPTAGQHLRAILTKHGVVKAIVRARFV